METQRLSENTQQLYKCNVPLLNRCLNMFLQLLLGM